ncbi:hypothetical protein GOP47_0011218 [Adiantum capillus-veneris]|uniref:RNA-dependent RNA polymerase n=1 Tax=Adiantum capillus-veneris TaxID=13818 RepID=A0A9D4USR8_ADICA|nr:hypothetical protein GOP47_0011218 [Adiantum capillus-veneris]
MLLFDRKKASESSTAMSASQVKGSNAVMLYDLEGYDDAFLRAVEKVEETHSSPRSFSSPLQCLQVPTQSTSCNRKMGTSICREDLTPKKLDFNVVTKLQQNKSNHNEQERLQKLSSWYVRLVAHSNGPVPPLDSLEALGELSQEQALLVLSHFPKGGWEKAVSVKELKRLKNMELCEIDGWMNHFAGSQLQKTNWSKQDDNHVVFHGEIDAEGFWSIKGPYFEQTNSALQRVFGDGGVLRVHFADLKKNSEIVEGVYRRISRDGIWVGLRRYMFFAFKDPKGKKKQSGFVEDLSSVPKCFFVCTESLARWDSLNSNFHQYRSVRDAQQYLMHIGTVPTNAKKFSRLQLCLSQTLPILDLNSSDIKVEIIEDIFCRGKGGEVICDANGERLIHTDGTGFISSDLAAHCPPGVFKGNARADSNDREPPLLLQVRLFYKGLVAKGTLLVNLKLPASTIQLRKSMVKVTSDKTLTGPCYNSLEVCATSRRPGKAKLSPYIALLLTYGGVPEASIMSLAEEELLEITMKLKSRTAALTALKSSEIGDHFDPALRMLAANVPMEEPYLKKTLLDLTRFQLQELSTGRVTIPDTYNLMGCADPTGRLERNQVAIVLEKGALRCPKVLVYKSPGLHVGDVKEFEATWNTDFDEIIGEGKYVIFFSVKGPRSVVDEIANSDLDGDQYWCCANSEIVRHFKSSEVWQNPSTSKKKNSAKVVTQLEDFDKLHFEAYLKARFKPSQTMGIAANSWHAHMDKYLMLDEHDHRRPGLWCKIQNLVNTYYDAVDAEKTGKQVSVREDDKAREWPHYKEKQHEVSKKWIKQETTYGSTTVLGKIYDLVKGECSTKDFLLELENKIAHDAFIDKRFRYPGYEVYHSKWEAHYKEYRARISQLLYEKDGDSRNVEIEALFHNYRMELYKSETLIDSREPIEEVYKQASAIYVIVYGQAQRKLEVHENFKLVLQFAWKVAGFALLRLFRQTLQGKRKEPVMLEEEVFRNLKLRKVFQNLKVRKEK